MCPTRAAAWSASCARSLSRDAVSPAFACRYAGVLAGWQNGWAKHLKGWSPFSAEGRQLIMPAGEVPKEAAHSKDAPASGKPRKVLSDCDSDLSASCAPALTS